MELLACIKSLTCVRRNSPWEGITRVLRVTDSIYVTENVVRAVGWKRCGWHNSHGRPIANHDLWDELLKARAKTGMRIDFIWQPGKKSALAKLADKAAKAAAQRGGSEIDRGNRQGGVGP